MNALSDRSFSASVAFDADDGLLVGRLAGIDDAIGFHASTVSDLTAAFHEAVDDDLVACVSIGKRPETAGQGQVLSG